MNDDEKKARLDGQLDKLRARARAKMRNDPEARRRAEMVAMSMLGGMAASRGLDVELGDDLPDDAKEAFADGYVSASMAQLATQPKWYTDLPLLGRLFKMVLRLRRKTGSRA